MKPRPLTNNECEILLTKINWFAQATQFKHLAQIRTHGLLPSSSRSDGELDQTPIEGQPLIVCLEPENRKVTSEPSRGHIHAYLAVRASDVPRELMPDHTNCSQLKLLSRRLAPIEDVETNYIDVFISYLPDYGSIGCRLPIPAKYLRVRSKTSVERDYRNWPMLTDVKSDDVFFQKVGL